MKLKKFANLCENPTFLQVNSRPDPGFTLIEVLVVLALIAILVGVVLITLNQARQFAASRNTTRNSHLNTIMNAVSANAAENQGVFTCATGALPSTATNMGSAVGYDIAPCLVPDFLPAMPIDPSDSSASWTDETDYYTGYTVVQDAEGRITVAAPSAELSQTIGITR